MRTTVKDLHDAIGISPDTPGYGVVFGQRSKVALKLALTNKSAPAITDADIAKAAADLSVNEWVIRAVRKVEAPRGAFDPDGQLAKLYERHVFAANTVPKGRYNAAYPNLSAKTGYGKGGYGSYASQIDKLTLACALDPHAALCACSWGAFQVLGANWQDLGYRSVIEMVFSLMASEAAHLDSFVRFVKANGLEDELRACRKGDPESCVPFVRRYNGPGYAVHSYHERLAEA